MEISQITTLRRDHDAPFSGQVFCLGQSNRADVLSDHPVTELGQVHGVATLALGQTECITG
jgi:hypothetical protein